MLNKEQSQSTGNNSVGVQASGNITANNNTFTFINSGLSYGDVKKICNDVFEQNFYKLSDVAKEIATRRVQEFIDKLLHRLLSHNPEGINQAIDPDFQYDIFIAQREYARCGDPRLADMLFTLLVERTKETQRSRVQIVLNESIAVASKLTREEYDILTLWFVSQYIAEGQEFNSISDLRCFVETYILPFLDSFNKEMNWHTHLVYAGCGFIQAFQVMNTDNIIHNKCATIIPEGFRNIFGYLVSEYPNIEQFLRIRGMYRDKITGRDMDKPESCMSLTSVGVAIGYANLCRVTGEKFNLSKWI